VCTSVSKFYVVWAVILTASLVFMLRSPFLRSEFNATCEVFWGFQDFTEWELLKILCNHCFQSESFWCHGQILDIGSLFGCFWRFS
jgi:hypothetical protein